MFFLSPIQAADDLNLSIQDSISISTMPSLASENLGDLDSISITSSTSVASMLPGRGLHSNISTGSGASINYSDSSSSIHSFK